MGNTSSSNQKLSFTEEIEALERRRSQIPRLILPSLNSDDVHNNKSTLNSLSNVTDNHEKRASKTDLLDSKRPSSIGSKSAVACSSDITEGIPNPPPSYQETILATNSRNPEDRKEPLASSHPGMKLQQNFTSVQMSQSRVSEGSSQRNEELLELLYNYEVVIVVDDSSWMRSELLQEVRDAVATLINTLPRVWSRGIDIHFFNSSVVGSNVTCSSSVIALFDAIDPKGPAPIGSKLEQLSERYLARSDDKQRSERCRPVIYVVITAALPTDNIRPVLIQMAQKLEQWNAPVRQVGIQLLQVGASPRTTTVLQELIDDFRSNKDIKGIINATFHYCSTLDVGLLTKTLLGGINRSQSSSIP